MRKEFPGYFKPTAEQARTIWSTGLIVFDTNALLNLYRYTENTRTDLLSAIRAFGNRVRIPYQVADEFMRNRVTVISEQRRAYRDVLDAIEEGKKKVLQAISKHERRHGLINPESLKQRLGQCLQSLIDEISELQKQHPDLLTSDDFVLDELEKLVEGHVLPARSLEDQATDRKWAQTRIDAGTPPGFKDKGKPDGGIGDALIWKEIIALAEMEKLPIIFVSDDQKEDWVLEVEGKKIGALPALRQELLTKTGQDFQHYNVQRFLEYAKESGKPDLSDTSIEEAETVREMTVSTFEKALANHYKDRDALSQLAVQYSEKFYSPDRFRSQVQRMLLLQELKQIQEEIAALQMKLGSLQFSIQASTGDETTVAPLYHEVGATVGMLQAKEGELATLRHKLEVIEESSI